MISVVVSFDRKGHSKNAGGREDIEHTLVEKVKKNKKSNKQTGKSKGKSVQIHEDIETQNISIPDDFTSTSMKVSYILLHMLIDFICLIFIIMYS